MNGVKVKITISLDVNTVSMATREYKIKNRESWLDFAFFVASVARYLKKPISSKKTERKVIDTNSTKIFKGLILESFVRPANTSLKEIPPNAMTSNAPTRQTSQ